MDKIAVVSIRKKTLPNESDQAWGLKDEFGTVSTQSFYTKKSAERVAELSTYNEVIKIKVVEVLDD